MIPNDTKKTAFVVEISLGKKKRRSCNIVDFKALISVLLLLIVLHISYFFAFPFVLHRPPDYTHNHIWETFLTCGFCSFPLLFITGRRFCPCV